AKFVRPQFKDKMDVTDEYHVLESVPSHPNIVKPLFVESMRSYRRDGRERPYKASFLLTPWVDGTRLDKYIYEGLSPARCVEIVEAVAQAVAHLHAHDVIHRDLKPQNIIVKDGQPSIVDFNVSRKHADATTTVTGTPAYLPPGEKIVWDFDVDC